jgi:hypothetical protein
MTNVSNLPLGATAAVCPGIFDTQESTRMLMTRVLPAALLALASAASLSAQTTFTPRYTALNGGSGGQASTVQADLNGDGTPDLIKAPYTAIAAGDFNGDGKDDVFFYDYAGGSQLFYVGYGNGSGGFTYKPAPTLPGIVTGSQYNIQGQTTDVNDDGRVDLLLTYPLENGSGIPTGVGVRLYLNNGSGFTDKGNIYTYTFPSGATGVNYDNTPPTQLLLGDYDSDGHADVALRILYAPPGNQVQQDNNLFILYGNGAGAFTPKAVYTHRVSDLAFNPADINDDGYSDLAGTDFDGTIHIFRGAIGRTFTESIIQAASPQSNTVYAGYPPVIADFDGNGYKDIGYVARGLNSGANQLGLRAVYQTPMHAWQLGGFTAVDTFQSYFGDNPFFTLVAGDYTKDAKPDVILFATTDANTHPDSADFLINTGTHPVGSCAAPAIGIHVCSPGASSASPVKFSFSATSFYALRKMEVWVDGVKKSETYHVFANQGFSDVSLPLSAGNHTVSFFSGTYDGGVTKKTITVSVP